MALPALTRSRGTEIAPLSAGSGPGLVAALRDRTEALHRQAERTGVVGDLLRGAASRRAYAVLLRNLLPAYQELERGLERHRALPAVRPMARSALYRSAALRADLEQMVGHRWHLDLILLPPARRYADHIAAIAATDPRLLVAHAYVRYFGDLSGGQILQRLLSRTLGLGPAELHYYGFPTVDDLAGLKATLRAELDRAIPDAADVTALLEEAALAFTFNIEVSEAVQASTGSAMAGAVRPSVAVD